MRTIALAHDSATYLQISVIFAFNTHSIAGETDREELMEKGWWFNLPKILFSKIVHLLNIAESLLSVRDISPVYTSPYTLWCFCWKKKQSFYISPVTQLYTTKWWKEVHPTLRSSTHHICVHSGCSGAGSSSLKNERFGLTLFTGPEPIYKSEKF